MNKLYYRSLFIVLLLTPLCFVGRLQAQVLVSNYYTFSQSNGSYTPIVGGSVLAVATDNTSSNAVSLDQGNYSMAIPFNFNFNGTIYNSINVNANGYITFGATLPAVSTIIPISGTEAYDGAASAMGKDLWGVYGTSGTKTSGSAILTAVTSFYGIGVGKPIRGASGIAAGATIVSWDAVAGTITMSAAATSAGAIWIGWPVGEIRAETIGIAPFRTLVIQFKDMADFLTSTPDNYAFDFQIQIDEANGVPSSQLIRFVYGSYAAASTAARTNQVGLRGASNTDFNNRSSATDWSATSTGGTNTASVTRTNTIFPASGLTYTWTPIALCTGTPTAGTATTINSNICAGNTTTISLTGYTTNASGISLQWQESATLGGSYTNVTGGTGANSAIYTSVPLLANAYYRCRVTCTNGGGNIPSNEVAINVNNPLITGTTPATRCGTGPVTLNATANAGSDIKWYSAASGGFPIYTGSPYNIPSLSTTTDYWVSAATSAGSGSVGLPSVITTNSSGSGITNFGLVFDVYSAFTLNSVTIYPVSATSAAGTVTIDVINGSGTIVNQAVVNVVGSPSGTPSPQTVNLNFQIAPGTNYKLRPGSFTGISGLLFEPSAGAPVGGNYGYPFTIPGVLSIQTSTLTAAPSNTARNDLYYYFYNWQITSGCESARTQVTATVNTAPTLTVTSGAPTACVGSSTTVNVTSPNDPNYTYSWTSSPAGFTASGNGPHIVSPSVNTTYTVNAVDNTAGTFSGCAASGTVDIISGVLTAGTISAPQAMYCTSGSPTLTLNGSSGGTIQWQESTVSSSGPWNNVGTGTTAYAPGTVSQTTYYRVQVTCQSSTVTTTVFPVTILSGTLAAGTYTINSTLPSAGGNFNSFKDAITAMTCAGTTISGAYTFNVGAGSGPYNEQIILPAFTGSSASNTITINGNGATINYASSVTGERAAIKLNGTDYTTINNLNINVAGNTYGFGIQLLNDADNNTISNCTINGDMSSTSTTNYVGIIINSTATAITTTGASLCDNNTITGCTINGGYAGIALVANTTTSMINNNSIVGNTIKDFYAYGVYLNGGNNTLIEGNDISRPTRSTLTTYAGIYLTTNSTNTLISKNRLHNPYDASPANANAMFAIYLTSCNATAGNENIISNNLIYNIFGATGNHNGVLHNASSYAKYLHNTISLEDATATCTACGTRGFYIQGTTPTNLTFQNNIVTIKRSSTGWMEGIFFEPTLATVGGYNIDGNDYYFYPSVTNPNKEIARTSGTSAQPPAGAGYATINDWRTASGKEINSKSVDPVYINIGGGNLAPTSAAVDNIGVAGTGITTDINGLARSVSTPDAGAYEFTAFPLSVKLLRFTANISNDDVNTSWTVAEEAGINTYEIERSTDGKNFISVGEVKATPNTAAEKNYLFTDAKAIYAIANNIIYYRLKLNENGGGSSYSNVVKLNLGNKQETVSVYPNPFTDQLFINANLQKAGVASIQVSDLLGRVVLTQNEALNAGSNTVQLQDVKKLAPGVYHVSVEVNGNNYVQKLVK